MTIISIGEILWDVFDTVEHIGGATFNFSAHSARLGHDVLFISAVGNDDRGRRALERMQALKLSPRYVRQVPDLPTGCVSVFLDPEGQPDFTIHRPVAYDAPELKETDMHSVVSRHPEWVYFGTLSLLSDKVKALTLKLLDALPRAKRIYDVNLRKDSYTPSLVQELLGYATFLKVNDQEVAMLREMFHESQTSLPHFCREYQERMGLEGVCVTRGVEGCALLLGDEYVEAPGYSVEVADTVGAGDAFAAALVHGIGAGWKAGEIADFANRLGALIATREGAVPEWTMQEVEQMKPSKNREATC